MVNRYFASIYFYVSNLGVPSTSTQAEFCGATVKRTLKARYSPSLESGYSITRDCLKPLRTKEANFL
jgi:hypothetical protein